MLNNLKKSSNKGFTIIEVMIVLAIAGLIILIVLLAVPALQRNGRNTAIKNDASAVVGAASEFRSNNEGANPTTAANFPVGSSTILVSGAAGTTEAEGKVQAGTLVANGAGPSTGGVINVAYGAKCANSTSFAASGTLNTRAIRILYNIETSSGVAPRCIDA